VKIVYGRDQKIKGSLTGDFDKDYAFLEAVFERSGDIVKNPFCIADFCRAAAIYVDGMTDADMVEDFVIRPLLKQKWEEKISGWELLSYIENHVMETVDWKEDETFENILTDILSGNTLLLLEGCKKAIILSTKKYPSRGVGETQQEMVIRGPKDSFTENMRINTALIRRRIRDPEDGTYDDRRTFENRPCDHIYGRSCPAGAS
jgi:spore germination protein